MRKGLALTAGEMEQVEDCFRCHLQSETALIREMGEYILAGGGKRVRPMLVLLCARLCGYGGEKRLELATVVEYIHTASLLHDDVVDGAGLRRGRPAANTVWGNAEAVLVGDYLYSEAYRLMVRIGDLRVLHILADATCRMSEGELNQLRNVCDLTLDELRYQEVVQGKTAILIAGCCRTAAILAGVDDEREAALDRFGMLLGTAFQLLDDALDYVADARTFGKVPGQDLREGKVTLPLIHALDRASREERAQVERLLHKPALEDEDLVWIGELINRYHGVEYTRRRAREMVEEAKGLLRLFPASEAQDALDELADYIVIRQQ